MSSPAAEIKRPAKIRKPMKLRLAVFCFLGVLAIVFVAVFPQLWALAIPRYLLIVGYVLFGSIVCLALLISLSILLEQHSEEIIERFRWSHYFGDGKKHKLIN